MSRAASTGGQETSVPRSIRSALSVRKRGWRFPNRSTRLSPSARRSVKRQERIRSTFSSAGQAASRTHHSSYGRVSTR